MKIRRFLAALSVWCTLGAAPAWAAVVNATYTTGAEVPVTASSYTATGNTVNFTLNYAPSVGTQLTVVRNTGVGFIVGTFDNLAQGQTVALGYNGATHRFVANYYGGTGNDLVLSWKGSRPYAWGRNDVGQMGNNSTTDSPVPVAVDHTGVLAGRTVLALASGSAHSVALCSDGTVATWGDNGFGQLGNNSLTASLVPVAVTSTGVLAGKTVVAVAAGNSHSVALCSDGTVAAWGRNNNGQLGNASTTNSPVPVAVTSTGVLAGKTVVGVAAGATFNLARCSDGTLVAWGFNNRGQLGNNSLTSSSVPVAVNNSGISALFGKTVVAVATGGSHSLALCSDGTVATWGSNLFGQLGDSSTTNRSVPGTVTTTGILAGRTVMALAGGGSHTLALCTDGTIAAWGYNGEGELGNNSLSNSLVPVAVTSTGVLAGRTVAVVSASGGHSLAHCADGALVTWGLNANGQLGDNTTINSAVPVEVSATTLAAGERFLGPSAGPQGFTSLALVAPPLNNNANLSDLIVSTGTLTPSFTPAGTSYTVSVPNTTTGLTLTPTAAHPEASIKVNNVAVPSGSASGFLALVPGSNTLTTQVTAANGTTQTYTVTVTRDSILPVTYNSASDVPLTANGWTATGSTVNFTLNFEPVVGTQLMVIRNTGTGFLNGTFANLAQGQSITLGYNGRTYRFIANYYGGTGNDLVLLWNGTRPYAWGANGNGQLGNNSTMQSNVPSAVTNSGVLAGKTVVMVAGGGRHSVALCSDGTVAAWGNAYFGQLGNNSNIESPVPVAVNRTGVLAGRTVVAVTAGINHTLALCSDGTVAAWGENAFGILGNNSTVPSAVPVAVDTSGVLAGKTVVAVAAGGVQSLALCSDGTLAAWGNNSGGQLGNNSNTHSSVPVAVDRTGVLAGRTVVAVASGYAHCLALCSDGTVATWGGNARGQLGNNSSSESAVPVLVDGTGVLAGRTVVAVSAGDSHSLAFCSDGTVATWGWNANGQLGNNGTTDSLVPVAVDQTGLLAGKTVVSAFAGRLQGYALCSDGTAASWGANSVGELGNNSTIDSPVPVAVNGTTLAPGERLIGLFSGCESAHSLALVAGPLSNNADLSGLVVSTGTLTPAFTPAGISYTVSVPNTVSSLTLTPTAAHVDATIQVNNVPVASGSASGTIVLHGGANPITAQVAAQDGTVKTYTVTVNRDPLLAVTFSSASDVGLTIGNYTATGNTVNLALNFAPVTGTELRVIDNTGSGFLDGTFDNLAQGQTVTLSYGGATYQFVANYYGGTGNDLVLVWKGTRPYAWGLNSNGGLGNNTTTNSSIPVAVTDSGVLAGKTVVQVVGGAYHSVALCSDGTVAAWGWNRYGQLGHNDTVDSSVPVEVDRTGVLAGKTVISVATGFNHTLALCSDGTVAAWGLGSYGILGNNSTAQSSVPVAVDVSGVLAGKTVVKVAAGGGQSLALCSDGTLAAWGNNFGGQLGNNSNTNSSVPVAVDRTGVLAGKTVVALASGFGHCLALCLDGTLATWGGNDHGQLGDNSTSARSVPVAVDRTGVLAGRTVVSISAGNSHSLAFCSDGTVATWGWNGNGQLGNNSTTESLVPVAVVSTGLLAGKTVGSAYSGRLGGYVLCSDGTAASWGANNVGQLGNNSTIESSVPVAVISSTLAPGERFIGLFSGCESAHGLALVASAPAVTPPVVATPTVASITPTTALLGGTVSSDGGGAITARGVVYAPTAVNANPQLGGAGVLSAPGGGTLGAFDVSVTNLTPGTAYTFAAYATNAAGTSYSPTGTFTTLTAVEYWRQTWYGSVANSGNGADAADPYRTGVPNLLVFAFFGPAQDPALAQVSQLPHAVLSGGNLTMSFTQPSGVTGVTYSAEWCPSLSLGNWQPVTDTGSGGQHVFSVPATGNARVFLRWKVTSP